MMHASRMLFSGILMIAPWYYSIFVSCGDTEENGPYPKNPHWSTPAGVIGDSLKFFFPQYTKIDSPQYWYDTVPRMVMPGFFGSWFASSLVAASEPVLYNYYLGYDQYRLLWCGTFDPPVVITLQRNDGNITLHTKALAQNATYEDFLYNNQYRLNPAGYPYKVCDSVQRFQDSLVVWDKGQSHGIGKTRLELDSIRTLTYREWEEFERLLNRSRYWTMYSWREDVGLDGAFWILEAHLKQRYWIVVRWSPDDDIRQSSEYLITLSGLNRKFY